MMKQLGLTCNESTMTTSVEIPNININMAQSLNMSMSIDKYSDRELNQTLKQGVGVSKGSHRYSQSQIPESIMKLASETQVMVDKPSNF